MSTSNSSKAIPSSSEVYAAMLLDHTLMLPLDDFVEKTQSTLQEPLLPSNKTTETADECAVHEEPISLLQSVTFLNRLKGLSFVTGSVVALTSQYVLSQLLWDEDVLRKNTKEVVIFSFIWSCWTCLIIFGAMLLMVWTVDKTYRLSTTNSDKGLSRTASSSLVSWDDAVFVMEAHHVVGSLISISLAWILVDAIRLGVPSKLVHNLLFLTLTAIWYALCIFLFNRQEQEESTDNQRRRKYSLLPTYQLIAATLGLIIGVCSQFVLSFMLWRDHMTKPLLSNVIVFSLVWSLFTVLITFCGCMTLRFLTVQDQSDIIEAERAFLRMESHYVFASLCGICLAWILIDMVMDMTDQILPSLTMLTVSLLAFRAILVCFPEDKCLEEIKQQQQQLQGSESDDDNEILVV